MANLLVEIEGSSFKLAWSEGLTLGRIYRCKGKDYLKFIISSIEAEKEKPEVMALISEDPIPVETETLLRGCSHHLMVFDKSFCRVAASECARYLFKGRACSVFHLGGEYSVDFVDWYGNCRGEEPISGTEFEIERVLAVRPKNIAVFTGENAIYFAKRMKNSIFVVRNLVLMGLALITDNYVRKSL